MCLDSILNNTNSSEYYYMLNQSQENEFSFVMRARDLFVLIYTPLLVLAGLTGNFFVVVIFLKSKLRNISSSFYLTCMGISDSLILLDLSLEWMDSFDFTFYGSNYVCKILTFINRIAHFLSVWLIVAFTVERFLVAVIARRQTTQKSRQAIFIAFGIFTFSCIMKVPFLIYVYPEYSEEKKKFVCRFEKNFKVNK